MILPNLNIHDVCFAFFLRDVAQTIKYGYPICSNFDGGTFLDGPPTPPQGLGAAVNGCPKMQRPPAGVSVGSQWVMGIASRN